MGVSVYGLPTCGKCKSLLKKLDKQGVEYKYFDEKETVEALAKVLLMKEVPFIIDGIRCHSGKDYLKLMEG